MNTMAAFNLAHDHDPYDAFALDERTDSLPQLDPDAPFES